MEPNRSDVTHNVYKLHTSQVRRMMYGPAQYDCETACLLRAVLLPIFDVSKSWTDLIDRLGGKGYHPMFRGGELCLIKHSDGSRICGLRFLGLDMHDLVARLGRPSVLPCSGQMADGEILH
ncbi:hypothetical protein TRL7639_01389 [Falsiruegeria litorea R37]|uniref:Uncharacterized protein n=1 Tax=Falsiruegeria litorea R37 TaxID=1200284 RepID=A0A1Y5S3V5_9RHOB|nr:hypothetical protein [Falsiruegeria litorea]SLN32121.1 hypothetical protein TRL7639_01389 [Falsiruegeria litorea R37]